LLSVLMSRRRAKDYKLVFKAVRKMMCVRYKTIVSDYESAPWRAVRECFPGVKHLGCYFHWSQAVLRHMRCDAGLQNAFQSDAAVRKVCKLFALPFLPASDIVAVFERIERKAQRLREYATHCSYAHTLGRTGWRVAFGHRSE